MRLLPFVPSAERPSARMHWPADSLAFPHLVSTCGDPSADPLPRRGQEERCGARVSPLHGRAISIPGSGVPLVDQDRGWDAVMPMQLACSSCSGSLTSQDDRRGQREFGSAWELRAPGFKLIRSRSNCPDPLQSLGSDRTGERLWRGGWVGGWATGSLEERDVGAAMNLAGRPIGDDTLLRQGSFQGRPAFCTRGT